MSSVNASVRRPGSNLKRLVAGSLLMVIAACGGGSVQADAPATSEARRTFPPIVTGEAEPTEAPAESPAAKATRAPGGATAKPTSSPVPRLVELSVDTAKGADEFRFVQTALQAPAGSRMRVRLNNLTDPGDEVGHNWVLVKPGQEQSVLANGIKAGDNNDWLDVKDPGIIAATRLIEGGQRHSVTFNAPAPGTYTFVCTFPEHYQGGMKGILTIK
jgi:azurin